MCDTEPGTLSVFSMRDNRSLTRALCHIELLICIGSADSEPARVKVIAVPLPSSIYVHANCDLSIYDEHSSMLREKLVTP